MLENKLEIINDLLKRTKNLPELLWLTPSEIGFKFDDQDKALLLDAYEEFDFILSYAVCLIIAKFSRKQECMYRCSQIDSRAVEGDFTISREDVEYLKKAWQDRVCELTALLNSLKDEGLFPSSVQSECSDGEWMCEFKRK